MSEIQAPGTPGQGAPGVAAGLTGASPAPAAPPAPAAAPESIAWLPGADELTVGFVKNKGWADPGQAVQSYQNLEKLFGADRAGNTIALPKSDATPEEMGKFFDRLGRPTAPTDYKIDIPDNFGDPNFAKAAGAKFHELGLTAKQGADLAAWWNSEVGGQVQQHQQEIESARLQAGIDLRKEWGQAFDQNSVLVENVARGLGLNSETVGKLESALGPKAAMELLHKIGSKMGEASFESGGKPANFGAAMTPAQAKDAIMVKRSDSEWSKRYLSGDPAAAAEMTALMKFAYPEE